ncbi:MAG: phosphatidylglycerol lysyltransferase domain-containing protein [Eubacterium sp.]|nr:phosphatidylglycerol lysyltransferase domain-containing protein [Eubacterium sp.]
MEFTAVTLDDYDRIYAYTSAFGEGSCQHSPVSMFSLKEKYDDRICEGDGFLFTLRSGLCDDTYRVYLAPLGDGDERLAYENIFSDAAEHGKKVLFSTLTESCAERLEELYPGRFEITEDRDFAEYIYAASSMGTFAGGKLANRRAEVHRFHNIYGERAVVSRMTKEDIPEAREFEAQWVEENKETNDENTLLKEQRMIEKQLDYFDELRLLGAVLRIDGEMKGFCYGTMLNDLFYDVIVEKGVRSVPHVYKVIRKESTRLLVPTEGFVNMEEDVGEQGLRFIKSAYKPAYLLRKFNAREK